MSDSGLHHITTFPSIVLEIFR
uniref:Uncharacterized protein n=1 Tax=Rhizophora mucronata TaxID=61149 RepID=A0A2P2QG41_RHIMU